MKHYIAAIHKDRDSDFGVSFPDFQGCVTAGSTLDEAMDMAREALQLHIDGMIEDGLPLPEPSPLDDIESKPDFRNAVFFALSPETSKDPVMRINITMRHSTLRQIDMAAQKSGKKRSQFLVDAGLHYLQNQQ